MTYHGRHLNLVSKVFVSETVLISPDLAVKWLATTERNRPLNRRMVRKYAQDMKANQWTFTGDPVTFDRFGSLIDGQHRLHAVSQQDEGFVLENVVHLGLEREAQLAMDQGGKRSSGQQLALMGYNNAKTLAGGVRLLINWTNETLFSRAWDDSANTSTAIILDWAEEHPDQVDIAADVYRHIRNIGILPAVGTAFALRVGESYGETVIEFFKQMDEGVNLAKGSPLLTFVHRLQRAKNERLRLNDIDQLAFLIVTWNYWAENQKLHRLVRPKDGEWNNDNFPELEL